MFVPTILRTKIMQLFVCENNKNSLNPSGVLFSNDIFKFDIIFTVLTLNFHLEDKAHPYSELNFKIKKIEKVCIGQFVVYELFSHIRWHVFHVL